MMLNGILYAVFIVLVIVLFIAKSAANDTEMVVIAVTFHVLAAILFAVGHTMTYWVLKTVDVGFDDYGRPLRAPLRAWGPQSKRPRLDPNNYSQSSRSPDYRYFLEEKCG